MKDKTGFLKQIKQCKKNFLRWPAWLRRGGILGNSNISEDAKMTEREKFEAWWGTRQRSSVEYRDDVAWDAWKDATAQQQESDEIDKRCNVCGRRIIYGERCHQCGSAVMKAVEKALAEQKAKKCES